MYDKDPNQKIESAAEANIELNKEMNSDYHLHTEKINSTTEANIKLEEEFYGDHDQTDIVPTYLYNNTPAIKITGED